MVLESGLSRGQYRVRYEREGGSIIYQHTVCPGDLRPAWVAAAVPSREESMSRKSRNPCSRSPVVQRSTAAELDPLVTEVGPSRPPRHQEEGGGSVALVPAATPATKHVHGGEVRWEVTVSVNGA